jgi:hypothetical protein
MSKVEQYLSTIRSKLSDEELSKVSSILDDIKVEADNLIRTNTNLESDLKSTEAESIERKKKIRTELEPAIQDKDIKIEELEKKITTLEGGSNEVQDELTNLRGFKATVIKTQKANFIQRYESLKEHPKLETALKVKNIVVPEKDDKGMVKWDDLKEEQVESNILAFNELDQLGFFKGDGEPPPDGGQVTLDVPKTFQEKVSKAKTFDEVAKAAAEAGFNQ